jgi:phospholipid/cholesterol/gamma-HCH transport system substrate-binding protein
MRRHSQATIFRFGVVTLVMIALVSAATFNLGRLPGFAGDTYTAEFADASGIHRGNTVQVAGMRVGRVTDVSLAGDRVIVKFEVDAGVEFGDETSASVKVLNLLGEKYLELQPEGEGQHADDEPIPLERTEAAYDIVGVFGDLTETTEKINKKNLVDALTTVSTTVEDSAPEIQKSFDGIARLSRTIASRDGQIKELLKSSRSVSKLLADRGDTIVELMESSDLVFKEVKRRKQAIHRLLVNTRIMARELRGLAADNQKQIGPALREVDELLSLLIDKEKELKATLNALGPYASILSNIIGTGPWFDAYASNLLALPTGEFCPVYNNQTLVCPGQ